MDSQSDVNSRDAVVYTDGVFACSQEKNQNASSVGRSARSADCGERTNDKTAATGTMPDVTTLDSVTPEDKSENRVGPVSSSQSFNASDQTSTSKQQEFLHPSAATKDATPKTFVSTQDSDLLTGRQKQENIGIPVVPQNTSASTARVVGSAPRQHTIASVIDFTRNAMPVSLSGLSATKRQASAAEPVVRHSLPNSGHLSKPSVPYLDASLKQVLSTNSSRIPVPKSQSDASGAGQREIPQWPANVSRVLTQSQNFAEHSLTLQSEQHPAEQITANRLGENEVQAPSEGNFVYVQATGVPVMMPYVESKGGLQSVQFGKSQIVTCETLQAYTDIQTRGTENLVTVQSVGHNRSLIVQPSSGVETSSGPPEQKGEESLTGSRNIDISHVRDAIQAAALSSGIVPLSSAMEQGGPVSHLVARDQGPMETNRATYDQRPLVIAATEGADSGQRFVNSEENTRTSHQPSQDEFVSDSQRAAVSEANETLHMERCYQFLSEENYVLPNDSVLEVLNILKNTVKYLTRQLHQCELVDEVGFIWEPKKTDVGQHLVPSCNCGFSADNPPTANMEMNSLSESSQCNEGRDIESHPGSEDNDSTTPVTKGRRKRKTNSQPVKIKKEKAEDSFDVSSEAGDRSRSARIIKRKGAAANDDDDSFSAKEEASNDDDDEDWEATSSRKLRRKGRGPRKVTRASARKTAETKPSPKRRKKAAQKPAAVPSKAQPEKEADRESGPETEDFVPLEGEETDAAKSENQVVTAPKRRGRPKNPPLPPGVKKEVIKKHVCEVCGSKFKHKAELRRHSTVHTGERPFSCEICGQTFKRHGHLYEHKLVHTGRNIVFCPHCNKKLKSKVALRNHIKTQHEKNLQHMCQICGRKWLTPSMLKYHIHNQHNTERVRCPKCPMGFAKALEMREHLRTHTNLPHICFICGDGFLSGKDALAHRDIQHADKLKNRCHQCGRGFQYATELRKHETTVHAKGALPFECTWEGCTKTFAKEYMMKYHLKMWHECETKACEICFKQVKVRVYKRHMLTHTGVKDFRCQYCSAAFSQVGNLKRHQRIHTGEKPYKCTYCEKAFNQSNALKQHLQMHLGGRENTRSSRNNNQSAPAPPVATQVISQLQLPAAQFATTDMTTANQILTQLTSGQITAGQLTQLTSNQLTAAQQLANQLPRFAQPSQVFYPSNNPGN